MSIGERWEAIGGRAAAGDKVAALEFRLWTVAVAVAASASTGDNPPSSASEHTRAFRLLAESVFFLLHMSSRAAQVVLDQVSRDRLLDRPAKDVLDAMLDSTVGSWPEHYRAGIREELFDNLNGAEQEYATCTTRRSGDPSTTEDLFARLLVRFGRNLSDVMDQPPEESWMERVLAAAEPFIQESFGLVKDAGNYPLENPPEYS